MCIRDSDEVERRVVAVLEDPTRSPFGNPIPSLEDVGAASAADDQNGTRAVDLRLDEPASVKVVQISEILQQGTEVQNPVISLGALVGQTVTLTPLENGGVTLTTQDDETVELAPEFAHALRVELTK